MSNSPSALVGELSRFVRWRGWVVLSTLLAVVVAVVLFYQRPVHTFQESSNLRGWQSDLARALSFHTTGCSFGYDVGVTNMPGVGNIHHVCVFRYTEPSSLLVRFQPVSGTYQLVYAHGTLPAPNQCADPLGHGWWQVVQMNQTTLNCPRGFRVVPAP